MDGPGMKCVGAMFSSSDAKLLSDGTFSDCEVVCGDKTWKTHKSILCTRSKWFMKALSGGFKESQDGSVKIEEFSPWEVRAVIQFLYTGVVEDRSEFEKSQYVWPIQLYRLADYFQIDAMMDSCVIWLKEHCNAIANKVQRNRVYQNRVREIQTIAQLETPSLVAGLKMAYDAFQLPQPNRMQEELAAFLNKATWAFLENENFMHQIRPIPGTLGFDILAARTKIFLDNLQLDENCRKCKRSVDSEKYEIAFTRLTIKNREEYFGVCEDCVPQDSSDGDGNDD
ncbi:hypothetical protein MKZ38_002489 [Zalerion maritima]|uniref:BTB domain-containing protein n=1 Tax=Zalerion maritima TaxID=339359 RepID=A0AAD5RPN9_9PEZI|nr:hypothetical protein MKZ38_002489 [Zalerion maritima]